AVAECVSGGRGFADRLRSRRPDDGGVGGGPVTGENDRRAVLARVADEAEVLFEKLRFYEDCVISAPADRSYDYAVYMTDPTANADEFDRQFDEYVAGMEDSLARITEAVERFVAANRAELIELGIDYLPGVAP
ncbi:hypothetical protein, partial [Nocardia sp. 852002-51244_SCH5132740]